ncbi:hypothetical protein A2630_01750 [Candidatus Woesebacteria bacterium RIFCSPHIGHO2_01_FULL_44_10]|uniref:DUF458 domain-containing protein n=1 Tax=Candidatus Woesebacteria bacterium RIFCSPLOWO2_01_FULL_44_14 TaxID=1802525 RepID=A0A1F8C0X8_9BACT|nr:MAG: hypothetical protein A2630_01750 [Candidatus Woesebacteria bacterium RIFCSPHIGHO2_01_FULL_44_10]OGM54019.1 MAG: hypothetical protein A3F62_00430 [Candidatus Woesebacteria bacterium RIFCSPHIGHO2_12_FULL_44_11]OGM69987.1 MAG: hypothetical protein A2975_05270 [Candidatus Woesebacteria bacterium RIFCSPLOWO2_01_FULL_44_14]
MAKNGFYSPSQGALTAKKMVAEVAAFVEADPNRFYRLVIGTDSQARQINGHAKVDFVTAIIIHRTGHGARYFWKKETETMKPILRDKIYRETTRSLEVAHELVPDLREAVRPAKYDLEIHIDVGALGPTREMIKEVVGMVTGNGYTACTKPQAWGASSVADKYT